MSKIPILSGRLALPVAVGLALCGAVSGQEEQRVKVEAFPLTEVRLSEGPCLTAQEANRRYLHSLDTDSLLYNCRATAGLPTPGKPLGGWEAPDSVFRGHFLGHYLSACALMYASAGDTELKEKADRIVAELAKCQAENGYLSAFPEVFFDRVESERNEPWAVPYYSIHKIMAGMLDMYQICGNEQALDVLKKMTAYFEGRAAKLDVPAWDHMMETEFGGMSEVLHNLYAVTRDPKHLALADRFDQASFLGPLTLEHDNLTGLHSNTHVPKVYGAARRYELTGDERYHTAATYFWDLVTSTRCYATGGTSSGEHWSAPTRLASTLSGNTQECCVTHNMLKLTRYLFRWTADPKYADYYELAYYNGILGTQHPETGMMLYYVPLSGGSRKPYGTPLDSFWCCYGTGIESFSKLGDSIYFHDDDGLYVNLFVSSVLDWKERRLRVEQVTSFPEESRSRFVVHCTGSVPLTLRIRVPKWIAGDAVFTLNGQRHGAVHEGGSYYSVRRDWQNGDEVTVALPMSLHAQAMPDDPDMRAILYGPLVLLSMMEDDTDINVGAPILPSLRMEERRALNTDPGNLDSWIKPVAGRPLMFRADVPGHVFTLKPFYKVVDETYEVYRLYAPKDGERYQRIMHKLQEQKRYEARFVDHVIPGSPAEREHNLQGEATSHGMLGGYHWRHSGGGWWSWDLKVLPDTPMTLACAFWGSDSGNRTFEILIDGERIATQTLSYLAPGEFVHKEFPIPEELTKGKDKVTVRFQARPRNTAGGVFGCAILRP